MSRDQIIRAWKDEAYRATLSATQREAIPGSPIGGISLDDTQLEAAVGAATEYVLTWGCCGGFTSSTCFCSYSCDTCTGCPVYSVDTCDARCQANTMLVQHQY